MGDKLEAQLTGLFKNLDALLDDPSDVILIKQIVLDRLGSAGKLKTPEPPSLNKLARDIFRISHQRNEALGAACCPDPEWNMLLELVVANTESRAVDVSSLCLASGVPTTTALRHIDRMVTNGLITRRACSMDKRRNWIDPTTHALTATEQLLRECYTAGTV